MEPSDVDTLADWLLDIDDLALFDRTHTVPLSKAAMREIWGADLGGTKPKAAFWFTVVGSDNGPVAFGGLQSVNYSHGDAVMPILVAAPSRGNGIGLRFACLLLDMAFDRLRLRRVTTFFRADNERTARLVRRAGFCDEGRMREAWFVDGHSVDSVVVGLLRDEWYNRREALRSELGDPGMLTFGTPEYAVPGSSEPDAGTRPMQRKGFAG
jgi:RimJ/RimL family protein N-acetyltransferase